MIGRKNRFHGHASLRFVHSRGQAVRGPLTMLKYVPNQRRNTYRLAVIVSKKVDKSAVARNRMRRRIYELVRGVGDQIQVPYDLVFTVFSSELAGLPSSELDKLIKSQLKQAGVLGKAGSSGPGGAARAKVDPKPTLTKETK